MRTFLIVALLSLVFSKRLNQMDSPDCNDSSEVFNFNSGSPAAAGLIQTYGMTAIPTCTERITTNCQPICTESLTRGCTEAPAPEPPQRNRFEGKYTWKGSNTNK